MMPVDPVVAVSRKVAVIGLGSMGFGMAASLVRSGFDVRGYDVAADALALAANAGVRAALTPAEAAADVDVIISAVVDATQTEVILFSEGGAASTMRSGTVFVSSATMNPERVRHLARRVEARGCLYLDAPMSGGAARAAEGALTFLVSGSDAALAGVRDVLAAMAAKVYELGSEPGQAAAFKMVNQLLAGVHIAVASEAIAFAARQGLDLRTVYEVITSSAGSSWMFENRIPHVLEGDYTPRSAVSIFVKDLGIVQDMARSAHFPVPMASAALQMFLMTSAAGMANDDDASVARLYARMTGSSLPGEGPAP